MKVIEGAPRRSRSRRIWRIVRATLVTIAVLVAAAIAAGYVYFRQSLPAASGRVHAAGLTAPADVVRDADGVPHISARTTNDALFALGFAHAQDRLWQMEMQRRAARGRLSEVFGSSTIEADRFMRTLSLFPAAQRAWQAYSPEARRWIQAYVAGINAFIAASPSRRLPPEFTALFMPAEPWTPEDVLVIGKVLAFNLSGNFSNEVLGDDLTRAVGPQRAAELLPPSPGTDLTILSGAPGRAPNAPTAVGATSAADTIPAEGRSASDLIGEPVWRARAALFGIYGPHSGIGSNGWAVGGSRTTTGMPLLANDVHLQAQLPSTWYVAHLTTADGLNVTGATVPGLPAVIIGRNESIGWGVTNLYADTQDLFREQLDSTGTAVVFEGQTRPLAVRKETIRVRRGAPVDVVIRETAHGPLLSDLGRAQWKARAPRGTALALRWTALDSDDESLGAMLRVNRASTWGDFKRALAGFVAPALSFVYADREGNIGYYAAGRLPVRRSGDGMGPVDGASGAYEWTASVPADAAPQLHNPPGGVIVTANNRPVPTDYPYFLGRAWEKPYRAERITQLLLSRSKVGAPDVEAIQQDTVSLEAHELLPEMLRLAKPRNAAEASAVERLRTWDGNMAVDSVAATLYAVWTRKLLAALVVDELGARLTSRYVAWSDLYGDRFLLARLRQPPATGCTRTDRPPQGDCSSAVLRALDDALREMRSKLGPKEEGWRWGALHHVVFTQQPFGYVPGLTWLFNRRMPIGGGGGTINIGTFDATFTQHVVASYRQVIDFGSNGRDAYIVAGGQSGHFLSPQYADFLDDWRAGRYRSLRLTPAASGRAHLRLTP